MAWPSGTRRPGLLSSRARTRVPSCGRVPAPRSRLGGGLMSRHFFYPVAAFMPTDAGGAARGGWGSGRPVLCVPCTSLTWSKTAPPLPRGGTRQMLRRRLFSLSAVLAPLLIAIYILQHLTRERSPP